jgi:hypothetical protein
MEAQPARAVAEALVRRLEGLSGRLGCHRALGHALEMTVRPTGAERQLLLSEEVGDLAEVVRRISGRSRLSAEPVGRTNGWSGSVGPIRPAWPVMPVS